jgi:PAS domain S-box-containing protein
MTKECAYKVGEDSRRFDALFNDPNLLVAILDLDGIIQRINQTALEYVDGTQDDIVGTPFWEAPWWGDEYTEDVKAWIREAAGGDYVEYEAEHPAADGGTAVVSGVFRPVTDDGTVTSLVVSAKDITERRRRKHELREQNKRFDEFASFISHDLQSPISAVYGRIELAKETGDLAHLDRAISGMERIDTLREDLVTTLRSGEIVTAPQEIDIGDAFAKTWEHTNPPEGATHTIGESVTVEADADALQRLLSNLLGNSIEHGAADVAVRVGALGSGDGFYYEDDGPGIDPDIRGQVFIPGYSTKSGGEGIGMGLASIRQIITAHDWQIKITDSDDLGGARFEIYTE